MTLKLVLGGPKHCGKTGAGRALAALTGCGFTDLDEEIARQTGQSARELYLAGPERFQTAEAAALAGLFDDSRCAEMAEVIALGGGVIDNEHAVRFLTTRVCDIKDALFVYLDISAAAAWQRIAAAAKKTGELPAFLRTDSPRETHRAIHERRRAAYRAFALTMGRSALLVDTKRRTSAELALVIRDWSETRAKQTAP